MSVPNQYFGRCAAHMVVALKSDMRRARAAKPERFKLKKVKVTEMDGEGRVKVVGTELVAAVAPISRRRLHELAVAKR